MIRSCNKIVSNLLQYRVFFGLVILLALPIENSHSNQKPVKYCVIVKINFIVAIQDFYSMGTDCECWFDDHVSAHFFFFNEHLRLYKVKAIRVSHCNAFRCIHKQCKNENTRKREIQRCNTRLTKAKH